jgi:hypothetical protein
MNDATSGLPPEAIAALLVDTDPYLSCNDCFASLDQYVERRIQDSRYDDDVMRAHLAGCGACQEEAETLLELLTQGIG